MAAEFSVNASGGFTEQATSIGGWTPLMGASYHGHDGMVAYLLV
jgi:ankyrin repeat protein